jgi:hypothetical protein
MGRAWIIATAGLKNSAVHKLSRPEINKLSISELCSLILTDPMSLRLSSTLLYGILLIYEYQSKSLLADVISAKKKLQIFNGTNSTYFIDISKYVLGRQGLQS